MSFNEAYQEKRARIPGQIPLEFHCLDVTHPRHQMALHWHMEEELIRVEEGVLELHWDGVPLPLSAGECVLLRGGTLHTAKASPQCRYSCLVLDGTALFQAVPIPGPSLLQNEPRRMEAGSPEAETVARLFRLHKERAVGWECGVMGELWRLLGILQKNPRPVTEPADALRHRRINTVKTALNRIRRDYAEPLTLAKLAREVQMSPNYFCRIFGDVVGRSPVDYLCNYRLEQAAMGLQKGGSSVTEVALSCGFNDVAYFSRVFKSRFGQTPRDYRKKP